MVFWYADKPPLSELAQFDWAVVEPGHLTAADVKTLRDQGGLPFAYLSVGEFHGGQAELNSASLSGAVSPVRNSAWNSQIMDLESSVWREHLYRRAEALRAQGYAGLFLDTLDSFQLLPESLRESQRRALVSFLRELHRRQPSLKLFFNRGFEVLPSLHDLAAAVAVESIYAGWDPSTKRYRPVTEADRQWLESHLRPLRAENIPLVAIEYLPPERRQEARALAKRLRQEGFVPYIGTPDLGSMGISNIEVQPRRIAGAALLLGSEEGQTFAPVMIAPWAGLALTPYLLDASNGHGRWVLDPFAFLKASLRTPVQPRPVNWPWST